MAKRPTRLRFTEDDLSSDAVKKAAGKAEKAAAKAEKAVDKITPKKHRKLRQEADVSASRTAKLRFARQRQMIFLQSLPVSNERQLMHR